MCISHYIDCLIKELDIDNSLCNPAYNLTTLSKEEIVDNLVCFVFLCQALEFQLKMRSWIFGISTKDEVLDLLLVLSHTDIVPQVAIFTIYCFLFAVFTIKLPLREIKNEKNPNKNVK